MKLRLTLLAFAFGTASQTLAMEQKTIAQDAWLADFHESKTQACPYKISTPTQMFDWTAICIAEDSEIQDIKQQVEHKKTAAQEDSIFTDTPFPAVIQNIIKEYALNALVFLPIFGHQKNFKGSYFISLCNNRIANIPFRRPTGEHPKIEILNGSSLELEHVLQVPTDKVASVLTIGETLLVGTQEGAILVYDTTTGTLLKTLKQDNNSQWDEVSCIAELDHDQIAASKRDGISIWDYKKGVCLQTIKTPKRGRPASFYGYQKKRFLIAYFMDANIICIYDLAKGSSVSMQVHEGHCIQDLHIFGGQRMLTIGQDHLMQLRDLTTGGLITENRNYLPLQKRYTHPRSCYEDWRTALSVNEKGHIITHDGKTIKIMSAMARTCEKIIDPVVLFSDLLTRSDSSGEHVMTMCGDFISVWDIATGQCLSVIKNSSQSRPEFLDERTFALCDFSSRENSTTIFTLDAATCKQLAQLPCAEQAALQRLIIFLNQEKLKAIKVQDKQRCWDQAPSVKLPPELQEQFYALPIPFQEKLIAHYNLRLDYNQEELHNTVNPEKLLQKYVRKIHRIFNKLTVKKNL